MSLWTSIMSLPCFKTPKAHSIQAQGMSVQAAGHARLLVSPSSHHSPFSLTFLHASGLWKFSGAFLQIYLSVTSAQEMGSTRLLVGAQWLLIDTKPIQSTQAGRHKQIKRIASSSLLGSHVVARKCLLGFVFFRTVQIVDIRPGGSRTEQNP